MIPTDTQAKNLWDTYNTPAEKRIHMQLVADVASFFAKKFTKIDPKIAIDLQLLRSSALLHDIDKGVKKRVGEKHPDAAVRILKQEGMNEVATVVKTHPVHLILDGNKGPKTIEQKLLFLADKMVKYEILTVDKRFALWFQEDLSFQAKQMLETAYRRTKLLEKEVMERLSITSEDVAKLVQKRYTIGKLLINKGVIV